MLSKLNEPWHQSRFIIFDMLKFIDIELHNMPLTDRLDILYDKVTDHMKGDWVFYVHKAPHYIFPGPPKYLMV